MWSHSLTPFSAFTFMSAPLSTRYLTVSTWFFAAATNKGVYWWKELRKKTIFSCWLPILMYMLLLHRWTFVLACHGHNIGAPLNHHLFLCFFLCACLRLYKLVYILMYMLLLHRWTFVLACHGHKIGAPLNHHLFLRFFCVPVWDYTNLYIQSMYYARYSVPIYCLNFCEHA